MRNPEAENIHLASGLLRLLWILRSKAEVFDFNPGNPQAETKGHK